ncbi:uncharacterized protein [Misgurnus anguillicaudatus]|uniref:uncharacterized protein isoform X2 n=1 Tax=Misgurnus anguillicaudatus TaxID=75329 RepID=UPI003CCFA69B
MKNMKILNVQTERSPAQAQGYFTFSKHTVKQLRARMNRPTTFRSPFNPGREEKINSVMDGGSALASLIKSALPKMSQLEPLLEALEELGVQNCEDMTYIQESDLLHILKPVEARKLLSCFKSPSQSNVSESCSSSQLSSNNACESSAEISFSDTSSSATSNLVSTSNVGATPQPPDNSWHYNFQVPWKKIPSEIIRKLETGKRPRKSERLEIIRLIVSEILAICPTPGKKHITEIARKMANAYPGAFKDVIEGEVVGSGYDSVTKQLINRVDNVRRGNTPLSLKRQATGSVEDTLCRKKRLNSYGCKNWQPAHLPANETPDTQKCVQEEMKKMNKERCHDTKTIVNMMRATFFTQRQDIINGVDTLDLTQEWPYLFETAGMMAHFKELTGIDIEDKAITNKCARVVSYFKCTDKTAKMQDIFREIDKSSKNVDDVSTAGFILLVLKYFSEREDQMFHKVDQTTLSSEVDCAKLPSTPCIIVCGTSPLTAENFMFSVDQIIVNSRITIFSDALKLMFASYYCLNISYPGDQGATLEFMQRCIFKMNPDKGSKVEKTSSKKQPSVSPKVLSLITKISDFEWME